MTNICYASDLARYSGHTRSLVVRVGVELFLLISVPLLAVLIPAYFPTIMRPPSELAIVGALKVTSITLIGFHTVWYAPILLYRMNGFVMVIGILAVIAYTAGSGVACGDSSVLMDCWASTK